MRKILIALLVLAWCVPMAAQNLTTTIRTSFAKESLTVSTSAVPLTATTYTPTGTSDIATLAVFVVEGCAVRAWPTGTAPTATVGQKLNIGDVVTVYGRNDIVNFKAIRDTSCAVDATLQVVYSR